MFSVGISDVFAFVFGLVVGSFLNVLSFRIPEEEDAVHGRSRCRNCGKDLAWHELIPLVSFMVLRGRCSACRNPISLQYPLVEFATGALFLFVWRSFGALAVSAPMLLGMLYALFGISVLIALFLTDLRYFLIPDSIVLSATVVAVIVLALNRIIFHCAIPAVPCTGMGVLTSLSGALFFLGMVLISRGRWMGLGDVKLAVFMGLFLGFANLMVALLISFFTGSVVGSALILLRKKNLKSEVPFGAFLAPATIVSYFFGTAALISLHLLPFRW